MCWFRGREKAWFRLWIFWTSALKTQVPCFQEKVGKVERWYLRSKYDLFYIVASTMGEPSFYIYHWFCSHMFHPSIQSAYYNEIDMQSVTAEAGFLTGRSCKHISYYSLLRKTWGKICKTHSVSKVTSTLSQIFDCMLCLQYRHFQGFFPFPDYLIFYLSWSFLFYRVSLFLGFPIWTLAKEWLICSVLLLCFVIAFLCVALYFEI